MTTKAAAIATLKLENPTLRSGDDERGYEDLSLADYEATISQWADNQLADEAKAAEAKQASTDKSALLAKLGMSEDDLKTLLG